MPTGKQGTIGPAIARFIAQDRAGLCYRQSAGWANAGLLPFNVLDGFGTLDVSGNVVLWPTRASKGGGINAKPIHYDIVTKQCVVGPDFPGSTNLTMTFCVMDNGNIIAHGAHDKKVYIYDVNAKTWTQTGSLTYSRNNDKFVALQGNKIGCFGGDTPVPQIEIYDVASGTWTIDAATFSVGSTYAACYGILLGNGSVLLEYSDSTTNNVAIWAEGMIGAIPQTVGYFGSGNRFAGQGWVQKNIFQTADDGNIVISGYNYSYGQGMELYRMDGYTGSLEPSSVCPRALIESVATYRPFDDRVLISDCYTKYFSGSIGGPVEYSQGEVSLIEDPGSGELATYVGSKTEGRWWIFGGCKDGNTGTRTIKTKVT